MVALKDIQLYTVQCRWKDGSTLRFRTVAVGLHPNREWGDNEEEWTEEQQDFDAQIFHYYEDYSELNQHLKDGDETREDFVVTKIINK